MYESIKIDYKQNGNLVTFYLLENMSFSIVFINDTAAYEVIKIQGHVLRSTRTLLKHASERSMGRDERMPPASGASCGR